MAISSSSIPAEKIGPNSATITVELAQFTKVVLLTFT